jgi:hypothetical protein
MEFIYANELMAEFSVFGHFYDLQIGTRTFNCRSVLEIVSKSIDDVACSIPNAVVVMMNPGSSRPLEGHYKPKRFTPDEIMDGYWEKEIVRTKPDNAQYQIMRLMLIQEWAHVRVLNLSDLRNGNSSHFTMDFKEATKLDLTCPHSLTHEGRHTELKKSCSNSPIVIAAWGSTEVLREAANSFLQIIKIVRGVPLDKPWYRYPSPYKKEQKIKWLHKIHDELKHD